MNIFDIQIFQYSLPFCQPFVIRNQPVAFREGVIIQLRTDDGHVGLGEIAPLPGLSSEPLKKALHQIKKLRGELIGLIIPQDISSFKKVFSSDLFEGLVPSVRFGVEMAVLHAVAQSQKVSLAEILGCANPKDVSTAGLLQGTVEEVKEQAERLAGRGYETFKLKVGSKNIPLDVKKVEAVQGVIGPRRLLRLDANRAWGLKEAVAFGQNIDRAGIEFMEEPLDGLSALDVLMSETKLPIALDESLHDLEPQKAASLNGVYFLVIKPMVMGGIIKTLDWIAEARRAKKNIIISSTFESAVGMTALANLATLTPCAAGLGTSDWLKEDLTRVPLVQPNGVILKRSLRFSGTDITMKHLTKIKE